MSLDRLNEKLTKAAGVAGRLVAKIESRADAIIAREDVIEKRTHEVFSPHEGILSATEKSLDGVEAQLKLLANDPLAGQPELVVEKQPSVYKS